MTQDAANMIGALLDEVPWGEADTPTLEDVDFEVVTGPPPRQRPEIGRLHRARIRPIGLEVHLISGPQAAVWGHGSTSSAIWFALHPSSDPAERQLLLPPVDVADGLWKEGFVSPVEPDTSHKEFVETTLSETMFCFLNASPKSYLGVDLDKIDRPISAPATVLYSKGLAQAILAKRYMERGHRPSN